MKIIAGDLAPLPDKVLVRALAQAHCWSKLLREGMPLTEIARRDGKDESLVSARIQLAYLAPAIQRRILDGTLPADITLERLVRMSLPLGWDDQVRKLNL